MKKMIRIAGLMLVTGLIAWSCAQTAMPTGGPKDEDPPVVLQCIPENYSTLFSARRIQVTFDEYIVLDNVNQQLVVSPPMGEKPEVRLKGKTLIIEFEEGLKENTTYTFNFGDAIKDLHEGNKLQNYEYVFSTGEVLDSMSIHGSILQAGSLERPEGPVSIMLYTDLHDSVPLRDLPLYIGRSNDSGLYSVNNMRPDVYKVFALSDGNNNFLFDLPSEEIAYLDSSIILTPEFIKSMMTEPADSTQLIDSTQPGDSPLRIDSSILVDSAPRMDSTAQASLPATDTESSVRADTTLADSLQDTGPDYSSYHLDLMLFTEASEIQYLMDYKREDRRKLELVFALPLSEHFSYHFLDEGSEVDLPVVEQPSQKGDSLTVWILDSMDYKKDSLHMALEYLVLDSMEQKVPQPDTLVFSFRDKSQKSRRGRVEKKEVEKLELTTIKNSGAKDLNSRMAIELNLPLEEITDSLVRFYHLPDTIPLPQAFNLERDTFRINRLWLDTEWASEAAYRLEIYPGALRSVYPPAHDTIIRNFETRDIEYYGQIILSLENVTDRIQVQIFSGTGLVRELAVDADGLYHFPFLSPKDYSIKLIHDTNRNGKWDTGNYLERKQPETVELIPAKVSVRSNWDHEVAYRISK